MRIAQASMHSNCEGAHALIVCDVGSSAWNTAWTKECVDVKGIMGAGAPL